MAIHYRARIITVTTLLLGAIGCGIALNMVEQPHPGWPAAWIILLGTGLTLALCGVIIALETLWHALAPLDDTGHAPRGGADT